MRGIAVQDEWHEGEHNRPQVADDPILDILGSLKLRIARLTAATTGDVSFPSSRGVTALAVSPDGARLAVGRSNGLGFLDAVSLEPTKDPDRPVLEPKRLRFSRSQSVLFYQTAEKAGTLGVEPALPGLDVPGFRAGIETFFAPALSTILRADRTHVAVFDHDMLTTAEIPVTDSTTKVPWKVLDVAEDGRFAMASRGRVVKRIDLATGRGPEATAPLPAQNVDAAAIPPGGAWAVLADGWANFVTLDLDTMKFATPIVQDGRWAVWALAASPDGRHWASARTKTVSVWRLAAEHPIEVIDLEAIDDVPFALAFGPDGALFVGTKTGRVLRFEVPRT